MGVRGRVLGRPCHPRSPDAAQRVALREAVRCRAGVPLVNRGPGSAERHEECRTASGTRGATTRSVIRGLDPRIHRSSQEAFFEMDGLPDQVRQ
jgi:hypothetical protein